MSEVKRVYSLQSNSAEEISSTLTQIGDRLDELEGFRGSPTLQNDLDMNGHKIINQVVDPVPETSSALTPFTPTISGSGTWKKLDLAPDVPAGASFVWGTVSGVSGVVEVAPDSTGKGPMGAAAGQGGNFYLPLLETQTLYWNDVAGDGSINISGYV